MWHVAVIAYLSLGRPRCNGNAIAHPLQSKAQDPVAVLAESLPDVDRPKELSCAMLYQILFENPGHLWVTLTPHSGRCFSIYALTETRLVCVQERQPGLPTKPRLLPELYMRGKRPLPACPVSEWFAAAHEELGAADTEHDNVFELSSMINVSHIRYLETPSQPAALDRNRIPELPFEAMRRGLQVVGFGLARGLQYLSGLGVADPNYCLPQSKDAVQLRVYCTPYIGGWSCHNSGKTAVSRHI
jgi:hypothetical protein